MTTMSLWRRGRIAQGGGAQLCPAAVLLLVLAIGVSRGAGAIELPQALGEAVAQHPEFATLLTNYTFRRSVETTGEVLDR
ncbi:MAG: hypothetical protein ACE5K9_11190, partial [Candidatus Methylomirabilales bacterium]